MHKHRTLNSACAITNEFDSPDVYGTLLNSEMSIENSSSPALWLPVLLQRRYRPTKVLESSKGLISATSTILPATIEHNNSASVVPWTTNPLTFREYYTICIYYTEIPDLTSLSLALSFSCALYSIYFFFQSNGPAKGIIFCFIFFQVLPGILHRKYYLFIRFYVPVQAITWEKTAHCFECCGGREDYSNFDQTWCWKV